MVLEALPQQRILISVDGTEVLSCRQVEGRHGVRNLKVPPRERSGGQAPPHPAIAQTRWVECSRAEARWRNRDPHALRGMASTRAVSRALRAPLGQIVVLAGYDPAGADELVDLRGDEPEPRATQTQHDEIATLIRKLERIDPGTDWKQRCRELARVAAPALTKAGADVLIEQLSALAREEARTDAA